MKHISDLFSKYKNTLTPPQSSIIKEFIVVSKEVCGFEIKPEQCTYTVSSKTIYLTIPSVLKSELTQKESLIIKTLTKKLGKNAPRHLV